MGDFDPCESGDVGDVDLRAFRKGDVAVIRNREGVRGVKGDAVDMRWWRRLRVGVTSSPPRWRD